MKVPYALVGLLALMGVFTVPMLGVPAAAQNVLSIADVSAARGAEGVVIPVDLTTDLNLSLLRFEISLPADLCDIIDDKSGDGPITGAVVGGSEDIVIGQDIVVRRAGRVTGTPQEALFTCADGQLIVAVLSLDGSTVLPSGSGTVFTLEFDVKDDAAPGCITLTPEDIRASGGPLPVELGAESGEFCIEGPIGDLDNDGDVDRDDLEILLADRGQNVASSACGEACDIDADGEITALDARKLVVLCTRPGCATE